MRPRSHAKESWAHRHRRLVLAEGVLLRGGCWYTRLRSARVGRLLSIRRHTLVVALLLTLARALSALLASRTGVHLTVRTLLTNPAPPPQRKGNEHASARWQWLRYGEQEREGLSECDA